MDLCGQRWPHEALLDALRDGLFRDKHHSGLRCFHNAFRGSDLVEWALANTKAQSRTEGEAVAQLLVDHRVVERCDHSRKGSRTFEPSELYRLWEDSRRVQTAGCRVKEDILNAVHPWVGTARDATAVAEGLVRHASELWAQVGNSGRSACGLPQWNAWERAVGELQQVDLLPLSGEERTEHRTAFFLNIYGLLAFHVRALAQQQGARFDKETLLSRSCYEVGGFTFSLSDIERGVLQGGFSAGDPRRHLAARGALQLRSPALLLCRAGNSPLVAYSAETLQSQLGAACTAVLKWGLSVGPSGVVLPEPFRGIRAHLGGRDALLLFVMQHCGDAQRAALQEYLAANPRPHVHFSGHGDFCVFQGPARAA